METVAACGEAAGEHEVGPHHVDLFGQPVIDPVGARFLGHGRAARVGGEVGDRVQLPGRRQQHCELVGAEVHRDDALRRLLLRSGQRRPRDQSEDGREPDGANSCGEPGVRGPKGNGSVLVVEAASAMIQTKCFDSLRPCA